VRRHIAHQWEAARVANRRACVVLLCSHYERYIYGLNDEATDFLNSCGLASERIPERVRLLQVRAAIDELSRQNWDARARKLYEFANTHAPLWSLGSPVVSLDAAATLSWMKSPKVEDVLRYFASFGEENILLRITRSPGTRRALARRLQGLVDSRNGIAHGDATVQPLGSEVTEYIDAVVTFATRVDNVFAKRLAKITGLAIPW
jgi:hypothetical protein